MGALGNVRLPGGSRRTDRRGGECAHGRAREPASVGLVTTFPPAAWWRMRAWARSGTSERTRPPKDRHQRGGECAHGRAREPGVIVRFKSTRSPVVENARMGALGNSCNTNSEPTIQGVVENARMGAL